MMRLEDSLIDELIRRSAQEIEAADDELEYHDERFLAWLAKDLREELTLEESEQDERLATRFAARMSSRIAATKTERVLPRLARRERVAPVAATVAQALAVASRERCVALLDLSVAAGAGREIWDEPCDRWLELPDSVPNGQYVAVRVSGDSMSPVLEQRDVILIHLDTAPRVNDLVVARLSDQSHVVKRVASIENGKMELASFNPVYAPLYISRDDPGSVVGTVIARFTRE